MIKRNNSQMITGQKIGLTVVTLPHVSLYSQGDIFP